MKFIVLSVLMGFFGSAEAATKTEIWELLQRIDSEIRYYEPTREQLSQAKASLEDALRALRGGGNSQGCISFAQEKYRDDGYSNTTALQKAGEWCRELEAKGASLDVLAFFFEKLREDGYSNATSLRKALDLGGQIRRAQLECVRHAYDTYRADGYSAATSLQKAAEFCRH